MSIRPYVKPGAYALYLAAKRFNDKNGWVLSSHIAMSLMLALFPFILFTVALTGAVAGSLSDRIDLKNLVELVFGSWPESVSDPIVREVYSVLATSSTGVVTLGGVIAIYFASNGVDAIRLAIVQAYHERDTRPFWKTRGLCIGLVILGGAGIMAAAVFELILPLYARHLASFFPQVPLTRDWESGLNGILVAVIPLIAVFAFHMVLPAKRHRFTQVLPGVLLTVILWWAAGLAFAIYISSFAAYSTTYAGLAGAMAALIFLYLNSAILILGAELNGVLLHPTSRSKP
ncbi:YihY/virulence factor BrkB family protein [Phaeobacter porticola]|uniref:Putative tRNA-processing ribonuclease n=1 Tax=Phaeobacter porticola TaxID=1844006 RepID=A0A1L3I4N9_9RHOB|nr:YihY/virulence factor BrkB family protein [Phaeobacter porticola]APG47037.1 putative tRNA-processing ribonuclease [Phaeobacter porticola]